MPMRHAWFFGLMLVALVVGSIGGMRTHAAAQRPAEVAVDEGQPVEVPQPSDLALDFYRTGNWLWVFDQVWSIGLLAVILATGFSARLRDLAFGIGRKWYFSLAIYWVLFPIVASLVDLPRAYYEEFARQHAYGLSNQTLQKWLSDTFIALAVACVVGPLVVWVPYLLLRKSPRRWWLYTAIALIPFIVVANLAAPIWIAPLFNKFEPMQDKALETRILALADRAGIE